MAYSDEKFLSDAYNKAVSAILKDAFREMIFDGKEEDLPYELPTKVKRYIRDFTKDKQTDKYLSATHPYVIVTINADKKYDDRIKEFEKFCHEKLSRKWIDNILYVFEQREKDPEKPFKGIHCHAIIERKHKRQSEIEREFKRSFKTVCQSDNKSVLNFRYLAKKKDLDQAVHYLIAEKSDEKKQKGQILDVMMREKFEIQPVYGWGELVNPKTDEEKDEPESGDEDDEFELSDVESEEDIPDADSLTKKFIEKMQQTRKANLKERIEQNMAKKKEIPIPDLNNNNNKKVHKEKDVETIECE